MNECILIGNLTHDPQLRSVDTANGPVSVCNMSIAVNERRNQQDNVLYVRVTAWRTTAENCARYLSKGRKIAAKGSVSAAVYQSRDGSWKARLELQAEQIEFLNARNATAEAYSETSSEASNEAIDEASGMTRVASDDLHF